MEVLYLILSSATTDGGTRELNTGSVSERKELNIIPSSHTAGDVLFASQIIIDAAVAAFSDSQFGDIGIFICSSQCNNNWFEIP